MDTSRPLPIPVIVNAASGSGWNEDALAQLQATFRAAGMEAEVLSANSGEEVRALAQKALAAQPPLVVAGGGDGTISTVASVLQSTGIALGVLPLGTLNHFARDLCIPVDVEAAVRVIAARRIISVDMGQVNERCFINNASLGIYTDVVRDRERQQRRLGRGKRWAMVWACITALRRSPFLRVTLSLDGEKHDYRAPFIFVGNNAYTMEGFAIGKRVGLQDGHLSLYVTQRKSRLGLVTLGLRALFGRLRQARDFLAATAQTIEVTSRHGHLPVATDGEVALMRTPLVFRTLPGALRVIAP